MQAGNVSYNSLDDLPEVVPVFPLGGSLLLPDANMPLNIFEPRYLAMIDDAMRGHRLIGIIQPRWDVAAQDNGGADADAPPVVSVGCLGRITGFQEAGDGRYLVNLAGVCRFRQTHELPQKNGYRLFRIAPFVEDLAEGSAEGVNREALLAAFKSFLEANGMEADWESVSKTPTDVLVNMLSMMSPYGPAEKQALLEAADLKTRAETLVAITEMSLMREGGDTPQTLQ